MNHHYLVQLIQHNNWIWSNTIKPAFIVNELKISNIVYMDLLGTSGPNQWPTPQLLSVHWLMLSSPQRQHSCLCLLWSLTLRHAAGHEVTKLPFTFVSPPCVPQCFQSLIILSCKPHTQVITPVTAAACHPSPNGKWACVLHVYVDLQ